MSNKKDNKDPGAALVARLGDGPANELVTRMKTQLETELRASMRALARGRNSVDLDEVRDDIWENDVLGALHDAYDDERVVGVARGLYVKLFRETLDTLGIDRDYPVRRLFLTQLSHGLRDQGGEYATITPEDFTPAAADFVRLRTASLSLDVTFVDIALQLTGLVELELCDVAKKQKEDAGDRVVRLLNENADREDVDDALEKVRDFGPLAFAAPKYAARYKDDRAPLVRRAEQLMKDIDVKESDLNRKALALAMVKSVGAAALPVVRRYQEDEPNMAMRLAVYTLAAEPLGAALVPILVADMLAMTFDHFRMFGGITPERYVAQMFDWIGTHDTGKDKKKLYAKLKKLDSKVIQRLAVAYLGKKSAKPKKRLKPWPKDKGWFFDEFATDLAKVALSTIKRAKITFPITTIGLITGSEEGLYPLYVAVRGPGKRIELELPDYAAKSKIPLATHEDDPILEALLKRHGFDETDDGDLPCWGDMRAVPRCLHYREILVAAETVVSALGLPSSTRIFTHGNDNNWTSTTELADRAVEHLRIHTPELRMDLAAICYRAPDKRAWLENLI